MARKAPPKAVPKALRVREATHAGSGEGGGGGAGGVGGVGSDCLRVLRAAARNRLVGGHIQNPEIEEHTWVRDRAGRVGEDKNILRRDTRG